jgi:hypothetical protein
MFHLSFAELAFLAVGLKPSAENFAARVPQFFRQFRYVLAHIEQIRSLESPKKCLLVSKLLPTEENCEKPPPWLTQIICIRHRTVSR